MYPRRAVGSVVGIGGMMGALGGTIFQPIVGALVGEKEEHYLVPLVYSASAYVVTLALIHALVPRLEPARV